MTQLSNTTKSEKYQQDAVDLSKQKALDADSRAIQQITFTGKIKATEVNTGIIIYYMLKNKKKQYYNFLKEQQKFCN